MGLFDTDRRHGARLELWLTGPDEGRLYAVVDELAAHGAVLRSGPWNAMSDRRDQPPRPWTVVLDAPAALDPTLVAGVAHSHGCRYHPCGGSSRWDGAERG